MAITAPTHASRREILSYRTVWTSQTGKAGLSITIRIKYTVFVDAETVSGEYDGKKMCAVPQHRIALNSKLYLWKDFFIRGGCHYTSGQYTISDFNNEFSKLKGYPLFSIGFQYECPYKPFVCDGHSNQSPSNSRAFSPNTLDQSFPSRIVLTHLKDSS